MYVSVYYSTVCALSGTVVSSSSSVDSQSGYSVGEPQAKGGITHKPCRLLLLLLLLHQWDGGRTGAAWSQKYPSSAHITPLTSQHQHHLGHQTKNHTQD